MKTRNWDPAKGDMQQGDVLLFRIPDHIKLNLTEEISARDGRLILAEGEVTGHHHAIWFPQPVHLRDDAMARAVEARAPAPAATAKLFSGRAAAEALVRAGEITNARLFIGVLVVEGGPMVLRHDEHDAVRIPPGRFYVGGQAEWDAAEERRVAD
jgi:hypothetical protein